MAPALDPNKLGQSGTVAFMKQPPCCRRKNPDQAAFLAVLGEIDSALQADAQQLLDETQILAQETATRLQNLTQQHVTPESGDSDMLPQEHLEEPKVQWSTAEWDVARGRRQRILADALLADAAADACGPFMMAASLQVIQPPNALLAVCLSANHHGLHSCS